MSSPCVVSEAKQCMCLDRLLGQRPLGWGPNAEPGPAAPGLECEASHGMEALETGQLSLDEDWT